MLGHKFVHLM